MRTYVLATAFAAATVNMTGLDTCQAAQMTSDITMAAITTGRLYVIGTTERPHTPVSLDGRFTTESDDAGKFQYELVYHPARCIVAAEIEGKAHEAVVSNCGQQGPAGPPGGAVRGPSAPLMQTGAIPADTATSKRGRRPIPPAALVPRQAPIRVSTPADREVLRHARFERGKPAVKAKVEQQEPYGDEAAPED